MTLDPASKSALLERLKFYREMGIGPLYRRDVAPGAETQVAGEERVDTLTAVGDELAMEQDQVASETYIPSAENSSSEDRAAKLRAILDDIGPNCQRCKLAKFGRKQIVFGTGDPRAELMFIGEGPGADEDEQGLPFVGRAGQLLNNMIAAMGLTREAVYIANIVKCRPPGNRTPERDECDTCSPFLMRQLGVIRPKVIVALRARFYDYSPPRTLMEAGELLACKLAVTYHPAFLLRDPRQKKEAWKDLQMVMGYL